MRGRRDAIEICWTPFCGVEKRLHGLQCLANHFATKSSLPVSRNVQPLRFNCTPKSTIGEVTKGFRKSTSLISLKQTQIPVF